MKISNIIITVIFSVFCLSGYSQNEHYPVPPKTDKLLFYIQRNHNANTIIYDANFNLNGKLDSDEPIEVYWRRYDEQGQKMELRTIEKWYAYGVECHKEEEHPDTYRVSLVAEKKKKFWLKQIADFEAVLLTKINNKLSRLEHLYIFADESGIWPKVKYIELFGSDIETGKKTYQKIIVN